MTSWARRAFTSVGLTQCPPGPHLAAVQRSFGGGTVILCIDVSGSMQGGRLSEAVLGAGQFVAEAVQVGYDVGLVLWESGVQVWTPIAKDATLALEALRRAHAGGGNDLLVVLEHCDRELAGIAGDRVVAIFGDGDISPEGPVLRKVASMKADNIRFVTRGLGAAAATSFAKIASDATDEVAVATVAELADGIAGMSRQLRSGGMRTPP